MTETTTSVELRFLGRIAVQSPGLVAADQVVAQPKRLALLAYLALRAGYHRRDTLLGLLWPELDTQPARRALRQALHYLRESLGDVFDNRGAEEIAIHRDRLWCDAEALGRAIEARDGARVAELYGGEFLPGLHVASAAEEFGFWLEDQRRWMKQGAVDVLRRHARQLAEEGEAGEAVETARRALAVDPLDERSLRLLVRILNETGERAGAVQAYEETRQRVRAELDVDLSPETEALVRRVRAGEASASGPDVAPAPAARPAAEATPAPREDAIPALPEYLNSLVGRDSEIAGVVRLLGDPEVRLVTLTGPGGIGKSRMAVEVARRAAAAYPDGVAFVPLAPEAKPDRVPAAIAAVLGVDALDGRLADALVERLAGRRVLLVLDNFEHLLEASGPVAQLLQRAPGVDALVASRTPLNLTIEHEMPVPALTLPDPARRLGVDLPLDSQAVALFRDRAVAVDPRFRVGPENVESVIDVCRRLDGLPLAIELAAARIRHMPVQEIARRLARGSDILVGGARDLPDRQRTLASTIRWASDLLEDDERALFHGLSVFAGEFGLSAVEAIWPDLSDGSLDALDGLASLVDRALLARPDWGGDEPRYVMLQTIRDHAARELEAGGRTDEWRLRLTLHYSRWASKGSRTHLCEPTEGAWLARLDREDDNIRAILEWAVERSVAAAATIVSAVHYSWYSKGWVSEGRHWIGRVLAAEGHIADETRARLIVADGGLAGLQGALDASLDRRREGVEIYRALGDPKRVGWALQGLGTGLREAGDLAGATAALEEALELGRQTGDEGRITFTLCALGEIALLRDDMELVEERLRGALVRAGRLGDRATEARCLLGLGRHARRTGRLELAVERCEEALRIYERQGPRSGVPDACLGLADVLRADGRPGADALYARALAVYREMGNRVGTYQALAALAATQAARGHAARAVRMLGGVAAWSEADGSDRQPDLADRLAESILMTRETLGPEEFDFQWAEGRTYSYDRLLSVADALVPPVELRSAAG